MTFTEGELLVALRARFTHMGTGAGRYAFLTHVRTGAGFDQQEIDALVLDLWPSDHHDLHAFGVKCSRTDWLREIQPSMFKSALTRSLCDTFSVVAPAGVVNIGELPKGWGLLEAHRNDGSVKLRRSVKPDRLHGHPATDRVLGRGLVVSMMRAAGAVPGMTSGLRHEPARKEVIAEDISP